MFDIEIVQHFARLFAALDGTTKPTTLLGFDLATAPPQCRPKQLIILRSDSDDLTLSGIMRDWWVVSESGIAHRPDWPLPNGGFGGEFHFTSPCVKFATNGQRIRYSLTLGPHWYCTMESRLVDFGTSEDTVEISYEHKE